MIRNTLQIVNTVQDDRHFRTVILQHIAVCNLDDIRTDAIFKMIDTTFQTFHLRCDVGIAPYEYRAG